MGLSAQRPVRMGTLFKDRLNKSRRIKTLPLLGFRDISMQCRPLPSRYHSHPLLYPTCLRKPPNKNT